MQQHDGWASTDHFPGVTLPYITRPQCISTEHKDMVPTTALIKRDERWDNLKAFVEKLIDQEQSHEKSASFKLKAIFENTQNILFKVREQMRIIENQS